MMPLMPPDPRGQMPAVFPAPSELSPQLAWILKMLAQTGKTTPLPGGGLLDRGVDIHAQIPGMQPSLLQRVSDDNVIRPDIPAWKGLLGPIDEGARMAKSPLGPGAMAPGGAGNVSPFTGVTIGPSQWKPTPKFSPENPGPLRAILAAEAKLGRKLTKEEYNAVMAPYSKPTTEDVHAARAIPRDEMLAEFKRLEGVLPPGQRPSDWAKVAPSAKDSAQTDYVMPGRPDAAALRAITAGARAKSKAYKAGKDALNPAAFGKYADKVNPNMSAKEIDAQLAGNARALGEMSIKQKAQAFTNKWGAHTFKAGMDPVKAGMAIKAMTDAGLSDQMIKFNLAILKQKGEL